MKWFEALTDIQRNVLIASIIADGEITKCYPGTRRKNNSYREHYGKSQEFYRYWKQSLLPEIPYITPKSQNLRSESLPMFTKLYPYFYNATGSKKIPTELLTYCAHPLFLAVLYLDDGSLSISKRINHNKKLIYLTPHIFLYLQNYPKEQLDQLQQHITQRFQLNFSINKRKDGYGFILRFTSVEKTFHFLKLIKPYVKSCNGMDINSIGCGVYSEKQKCSLRYTPIMKYAHQATNDSEIIVTMKSLRLLLWSMKKRHSNQLLMPYVDRIGQSFIKSKNSEKITYYKFSFFLLSIKKRP